ncbi:hypothetical protein [Enterococcus xiangfangensis]|uniref:DNA-binding protein n=1 Tax=Enterococcus xiangfangensis TaxID=1296537 RepID=A0ABU3F9H1_9ENTE|nr:hypothetical protein [Enterococcus xiangfangensis]MDT2759304.1 hypothetical protein [Enterococcus xiangfangensis]
MLVYTIPELAGEYRTSKENVYILISLGQIKPLQFSSNKVVSKFEAERFLIENAGRNFDEIILEEKKRRKLLKSNNNIIEMKKEAQQ